MTINTNNFMQFKEWLNNNPDITTDDLELIIEFVGDYINTINYCKQ